MENHGTEKLTIKRGTILGTVAAVEEVTQILNGGEGVWGDGTGGDG